MNVKPLAVELLEAKDKGQGTICVVKVLMPDHKAHTIVCTWDEYLELMSHGYEVNK